MASSGPTSSTGGAPIGGLAPSAKPKQKLPRPPQYDVKTTPRGRRENIKEQIVRANGYKNIRLQGEDVAEFPYRPTACTQDYRIVVVRKHLSVPSPRSARGTTL